MGEAEGMEVVKASSGGDSFHTCDGLLADGADFLRRGLPELEHGVMGKPLDLSPFYRSNLGTGEKELKDLRVGRSRAAAHWGRWRDGERHLRRGLDRAAGREDHEVVWLHAGGNESVP